MKRIVKNSWLRLLTLGSCLFTGLFSVIQASGDYIVPDTGDNAPTLAIFVIMACAAVALVVTLLMIKRRKK